jgi:hypothetical protein
VLVTGTAPFGSSQAQGTLTVERVTFQYSGQSGRSVYIASSNSQGAFTVTLRQVGSPWNRVVLSTPGGAAAQSHPSTTPAKAPDEATPAQPDAGPSDRSVSAVLPVNPAANDDTPQATKLVSSLDEVLGVNESSASNFIAGAISPTSGTAGPSSTRTSAASAAADPLIRWAGVGVAATYGAVSAAPVHQAIASFTSAGDLTANVEHVQPPSDVLIASANPIASTAVRRFFGFTPLNMPFTLSSDPIASLAEDFASTLTVSLSTPVLAHVHRPGPWELTFAVLAADVILVAYIHRRWLRARMPRLPGWSEAYVQPCSNI